MRRKFFIFLLLSYHSTICCGYDLTSGTLISRKNIDERIEYILSNSHKIGAHDYEMEIDNIRFLLKISKDIRKWRVEMPSTDFMIHHCLIWSINPIDNTGVISTINGNGCHFTPEQSKGIGNLLLKVVDNFSTSVGIKKNSLEDASTITCEDHRTTSLAFLHFLKNGKSWYESKGYTFRPSPRPGDKGAYSQSMKDYLDARNYVASLHFQDIELQLHPTNDPNIYQKNDWWTPLESYKHAHPIGLLKDFLLDLWEENCKIYIKMTSEFPPAFKHLHFAFKILESPYLPMEKFYPEKKK
jgi:hypothetical protein